MRKIYFIISFVMLAALFILLYFIGIINLWFPESNFLQKYYILYFGKPVFAFFYLIFISIFFILFMSIMLKLLTTEFGEKKQPVIPEIKKIEDEDDKKENKQTYDKLNLERIIEIDKDEIYMHFSTMIEDIILSATYSEVFEKLLIWSSELTHSGKCTIMLYNKKNELTIYKVRGRTQTEKSKLKEIVLDQNFLAAKVAKTKKMLYVEDINRYSGYNFKYTEQYDSNSFICYPIVVQENVIGLVSLTDNKNSYYQLNDLEAIKVMMRITAQTLEVIKLRKKG